MQKCECGGKIKSQRIRRYEDELSGLPGLVLIDSVTRETCVKCREGSTTFPNLAGMVAAAAAARAQHPTKLDGKSIRFMRSALQMEAKDLAEQLGVRPETLSRWENGKEPIGLSSEKLFRLMVGLNLRKQAPGIDFDPRAVVSMRIAPVTSIPVRIELTLIKVPRRKEKEWAEAA